jgi:hypothetical protein
MMPSEMSGLGQTWNVTNGVFRNFDQGGGGVFAPMSGLGLTLPVIGEVSNSQLAIFGGAAALAFILGTVYWKSQKKKKALTPNKRQKHRRNGSRTDLQERCAKALGWSLKDAQSVSLLALRDLVRPVDSSLALEISRHIQEGDYVAKRRRYSFKRNGQNRVSFDRGFTNRWAVTDEYGNLLGFFGSQREAEIASRSRSSSPVSSASTSNRKRHAEAKMKAKREKRLKRLNARSRSSKRSKR